MFFRRAKGLFKNTLFRIVVIVIFLLLLPSLFILKLQFNKSEKMLTQATARLISENLNHQETRIEDMMYASRKLSSITSTDSSITGVLKQMARNPAQQSKDVYSYTTGNWENVNRIQNIMMDYRNTFFDYQSHDLLISRDGTVFCVLDGINDDVRFRVNFVDSLNNQAWYQQFLNDSEQSVWVAPCRYNSEGIFWSRNSAQSDAGILDYKNYIIFVRKINDFVTQQNLGISVVSLYTDNIRNFLSTDKNNVIALVNSDGNLIYSTDVLTGDLSKSIITASLIKELPDGNSGYISARIKNTEYMVNYCGIDGTTWKLVYLLPKYTVTSQISTLRDYTFGISFAIWGTALIVCIVLLIHIMNPIKRLVKSAREIRIGEHIVGQGEEESTDLRDIEATFNHLLGKIEDLANTVLKEQKLESQLRFETLRAQINPHFLFNTLNSIKWSAMVSGAGNIAEMISSLGELLEASTKRGEDIIPLEKELEIVKSYATIKNLSLKTRFELKFDIDKTLYNYKVIKFCLQPIVENAIIHGMEGKSDGVITVRAFRSDDAVIIQVIDNGLGMTPQKCKELLDPAVKDHPEANSHKFSGIGISSIDGLIRLKYGQEYGLRIQSQTGEGTVVTYRFPLPDFSE